MSESFDNIKTDADAKELFEKLQKEIEDEADKSDEKIAKAITTWLFAVIICLVVGFTFYGMAKLFGVAFEYICLAFLSLYFLRRVSIAVRKTVDKK